MLNEPLNSKTLDPACASFWAWEKLRVVYNIVLVVVVLLPFMAGMGPSIGTRDMFWRRVAIYALMANGLFCSGLVVENYFAALKQSRRLTRGVLFVAGTAFSAFIALVVVVSWGSDDF